MNHPVTFIFRSPPLCLLLLALLGAGHLSAQTGAATAADKKWEELQARLKPAPAPRQSQASRIAVPAEAAREQETRRLFQVADAAIHFSAEHSSHPKAKEAGRIAARSLLQAALAGNASRVGEAKALVEEIRRDQSQPAGDRLDLSVLAEAVRLRPQAGNRREFLAAHESSARALIGEFPREPGAYRALLRAAQNHPLDSEAIRIARDLVAMNPPAEVAAEARAFLDRQALVGRSLAALAAPVAGRDNPFAETKGRGFVLYTWSVAQPASVQAGKQLAGRLPPAAVLVGINLDEDVAAARALVAAEALPGRQLYDARALAGPLAQALKLDRAGQVYVADRQGLLRSVSAHQGDLADKLGRAGR